MGGIANNLQAKTRLSNCIVTRVMSELSVFKRKREGTGERERGGELNGPESLSLLAIVAYHMIQTILLLVRKRSKFVRHVRRAGSDILSSSLPHSLPPVSLSYSNLKMAAGGKVCQKGIEPDALSHLNASLCRVFCNRWERGERDCFE